MKTSILSMSVLLLAAVPSVRGDTLHNALEDPCFRVTIQTDRVNRSSVRQTCDRNINRTIQAGARNWAHTSQAGSINDNKVRQYHYDRSRYFKRMYRR